MPRSVISVDRIRRKRSALPPWFRVRIPSGDNLARFQKTDATVEDGLLNTVCREANCPNIHECWGRGTATFMIGGQHCTRTCRFCAVEHRHKPPPPDPDEPRNLATAIEQMGLSYAVITVVNRDDLPDEGASHFRACLDTVNAQLPEVGLEFLGGDMDGNDAALQSLLDGAPLKVFAHNVECVEKVTPSLRDRKASYRKSLHVLEAAKAMRPDLLTKSSLMVGLGETGEDVTATMKDLRSAGVDLMTFGQYLAPSQDHHPVMSFPPPEQFDAWKEEAFACGFLAVASAPLVRSSYQAGRLHAEAMQALGSTAPTDS